MMSLHDMVSWCLTGVVDSVDYYQPAFIHAMVIGQTHVLYVTNFWSPPYPTVLIRIVALPCTTSMHVYSCAELSFPLNYCRLSCGQVQLHFQWVVVFVNFWLCPLQNIGMVHVSIATPSLILNPFQTTFHTGGGFCNLWMVFWNPIVIAWYVSVLQKSCISSLDIGPTGLNWIHSKNRYSCTFMPLGYLVPNNLSCTLIIY